MRGIGTLSRMRDIVAFGIRDARKSFWQRVRNPEGASRPVFLVGCGRSGTSMLVRQLSKSWMVNLYNEDHDDAFNNYRLRSFNTVNTLVEQSQAPITMFKPILDTVQTPKMLARFPKSRVIFAFRQPDDVVNSSLKRFGRQNRINHIRRWMHNDFSEFAVAPPPEPAKEAVRRRWRPDLSPESGAALYWLFYNRLFYDLSLDQDERVLLMRYESLVTEPARHFQHAAHFLGMTYEPAMAEGVFASSIGRDETPNVDPQIRADCEALYQKLSAEFAQREGR